MPAAQHRQNDGFYFIVVDGVPSHCQWQELKDYLRESVQVNPGYANVLRINEDGTRVGFCPLRDKADANKAFEYLVAEGWRGLDIRVSIIWKADRNSEQIERRRGPEQSRRRRMTNTTPAIIPFSVPTSTRPSTGYSSQDTFNMAAFSQDLPPAHYITQTNPTSFALPQYQHSFSVMAPIPMQQQPMAASPIRTTSQATGWSPISGPILPQSAKSSDHEEERIYTGRQSIHISRLPHDTTTRDLRSLLSNFGQVLDVSLKRGKEKRCSATAKFSTSEEAALAIRHLDGRMVKKMAIVVRLDRSEVGSVSSAPSTTSRGSEDSDSSASRWSAKQAKQMQQPHKSQERSGPLIVNGARGPSYNKRRGGDDDSEGMLDTTDSEDERAKIVQGNTGKQAHRKTPVPSSRR